LYRGHLANKDVGEAFTMLTMEPGPDIAPYHDRQIVILTAPIGAGWRPSVSAKSLIKLCRLARFTSAIG
jgi:putative SOS response-associated peptidase YedK